MHGLDFVGAPTHVRQELLLELWRDATQAVDVVGVVQLSFVDASELLPGNEETPANTHMSCLDVARCYCTYACPCCPETMRNL